MSASAAADRPRAGLAVEVCAAEHIGDRAEQQDRVALLPHPERPGLLLAVLADGMGGHSGGAMAAQQVLHKAEQAFRAYAPADEGPQDLLRTIVEESHVVIRLTRFTAESDPHSTAVALMVTPAGAYWAHCGDSRLYHFRDAQLMAMSEDHTLVGELVRRGRLTPDQAKRHPHRNVLLHCLGAEKPPLVAFGACTPLAAGDAFLLCSDGLWAYFEPEELGDVLSHHTPRQAAQILIDRARERARGEGDNLSLAIVKFSARAAKAAAA